VSPASSLAARAAAAAFFPRAPPAGALPAPPPLPPLRAQAAAFALTLLGMGAIAGAHYTPAVARSGLGLAFGSLAATAALVFAAPASPLAQPRNVLGGHAVSAAIGVAARVLIADSRVPGAVPLALAVAVAGAVAAMGALGVQHPAGGGTAYLAVASADAAALGWLFVPSVVLGAAALVAVALLGNLAGRAYPVTRSW